MKKCPLCNCALTPKTIGSVEVDECDQCNGIWFDKDEFRQTGGHTDEDLSWLNFDIWKHQDRFKAIDSPRQCPVCDIPMVNLRYGKTEVTIDYCPQCHGIWLDKGDLAKIIDRLENELGSGALSDYLKESIQEAKKIITTPEMLVSEWKDFLAFLRLMQYRLFVEKPGLLKAILSVQKVSPF